MLDDPFPTSTRPADRPARGAPERLLTVADAVAALRVSTKTVRRLIGRGEFAASRVGRQLRVDPRELRAFLRAGLTEP
jgi:excisionase family DNA binding protein